MIYSLVIPFCFLLLGIIQYFLQIHHALQRIIEIDYTVIKHAENAASEIDRIEFYNKKLAELQQACAIAVSKPETVLILKQTADLIAIKQTAHYALLQKSFYSALQELKTKDFHSPQAKRQHTINPCQIPGSLVWNFKVNRTISFIKNQQMGFAVRQTPTQKTYWNFIRSHTYAF